MNTPNIAPHWGELISTILGLVIPVVLAFLGRLLASQAKREDASTASLVLGKAGAILVRLIDQAWASAHFAFEGALAKARLPESPDGVEVSSAEWDAILEAVWEEMKRTTPTIVFDQIKVAFGLKTEGELKSFVKREIQDRFVKRALKSGGTIPNGNSMGGTMAPLPLGTARVSWTVPNPSSPGTGS